MSENSNHSRTVTLKLGCFVRSLQRKPDSPWQSSSHWNNSRIEEGNLNCICSRADNLLRLSGNAFRPILIYSQEHLNLFFYSFLNTWESMYNVISIFIVCVLINLLWRQHEHIGDEKSRYFQNLVNPFLNILWSWTWKIDISILWKRFLEHWIESS